MNDDLVRLVCNIDQESPFELVLYQRLKNIKHKFEEMGKGDIIVMRVDRHKCSPDSIPIIASIFKTRLGYIKGLKIKTYDKHLMIKVWK